MAERSRLLRALQLQRIAETARKINPNFRPTHTTSITPTILKSLPEHKPLLPLLLSHDVPPKLARVCADKYDTHANELRSKTETKLAPYLLKPNGDQPTGIYSVFLENYSQALRDWAQSVLNAALKNLKRESVQLRNWEATYPAPLWLPSPPNPHPDLVDNISQRSCLLSSACAPSHAFPTTYPPPLRPPSGLSPVEWLRTPTASSHAASTSTIDLDSLCSRFKKSLVIDENPMQPSQRKTSIFSPPIVLEERGKVRPSVTRSSREKLSRTQPSSKSTSPTSPLKTRQLSVPPPFPSPFARVKSIPRKTSAPVRVSPPRYPSVSPQSPGSTRKTTPTTSHLNAPTAYDLGIYSYNSPRTPPPSPQPFPDFTLGQITHPPQRLPSSSTVPAPPPDFSPNLFYEPTITPFAPAYLSPGSSLNPISDSFTQLLLQNDHPPSASPVPLFDYSRLSPGLGLFSKNSYDTPLGSDVLSYGIPAPMTSTAFENNFLSTYAVF